MTAVLQSQRTSILRPHWPLGIQRDGAFPLSHGRGDEFHNGSSLPDPRSQAPKVSRTRDMYVRDLHIGMIRVKTRDFR